MSLCAIELGLSLLQRTRARVLPYRPGALREAARVHRVRVDCRASFSPEKAGRVTELLRHGGTKGDGRRGGVPRRAVEPWHVQRRHALRSGAFDNVRSHRLCILPASAQFQSGRGHLGALQFCGVDVVGAMCPLLCQEPLRAWENDGQQGFCHLPLGLGERHQCHKIF